METWKSIAINYFNDDYSKYKSSFGDGRRPDSVKFSTIEEDVKRRDFTINALFYDSVKEEIVDLVGGIDDLKNGIIRCVGDPIDRFYQDRLRMLRALRFSAVLDFTIEDNTFDALIGMFDLSAVSRERIAEECRKVCSNGKEAVIRFLGNYIFKQKFPFSGEVFSTAQIPFFGWQNVITEDISTLLAVVYCNSKNTNNKNFFVGRKFTDNEARRTLFLISIRQFKPDYMYVLKKEFEFCKEYKGLKDSDVLNFFEFHGKSREHAQKFIDFKITLRGDDFKGKIPDKEIGMTILRKTEEQFLKFLKGEV